MVRENDFYAIEKSAEKYLNKTLDFFNMINTIEMFANATFNNEETKEFYNFLINSIANIEIFYFMQGREQPYHPELMEMVREFQRELLVYKKTFNLGNLGVKN